MDAQPNHPLWHKPSVIGKGMGRLVSLDFRDKNHLLKPLGAAKPAEVTKRFWWLGNVLDQGDTPQCVAYSGEGYLMAGPTINEMYKKPQDLYDLCQKNDEWAGTPHDGSSVRALFKVLQSLGYVKSYSWAFDLHTIVQFLLTRGALVFGTDWYDGMFTVDVEGFIHREGNIAGGHAYDIIGADTTRKCRHGNFGALRMQNTWGVSWGQKGRAWLCFDDAAQLIAASGEACTSEEIKFQPRQTTEWGEEEPLPRKPEQSRLHL